MADIKVCDRCGKRIDKINRRLPITIRPGSCALLANIHGSYVEYDLCEECYSDLEAFLFSVPKEEKNG